MSFQAPVASQTCGCMPLQRVAFGEQASKLIHGSARGLRAKRRNDGVDDAREARRDEHEAHAARKAQMLEIVFARLG